MTRLTLSDLYHVNASSKLKTSHGRFLRRFVVAGMLLCLIPLFLCFVLVTVSPSQQVVESPHFKFKWDGGGRVPKKSALEVSFSRYKSDDNVLVERIVEKYKSAHDALVELNKLTARASQVMERNQKKAWDGSQVGDRVQLLFKNSTTSPRIAIAWTDGSRVFLLRSDSLQHALDFERQDYPSTPPRGQTSFR